MTMEYIDKLRSVLKSETQLDKFSINLILFIATLIIAPVDFVNKLLSHIVTAIVFILCIIIMSIREVCLFLIRMFVSI